MDGVADNRPWHAPAPRRADVFLAGLQAGTLGTLWMLAWMGFSAAWHRLSVWSPENLLASAFHPDSIVSADFGWSAVSGLALYLLLYGLLGGVFAMLAARRHGRPVRPRLLAVAFALTWYYFSFHLLWKAVSPAIPLLDPGQSTIVGHLIYGISLGRFYAHYPPAGTQPPEVAVPQETAPDSVAPGA